MKNKLIENSILKTAHKLNKFQVSQVIQELPDNYATRQYISKILNSLVSNRTLARAGTGRFTFYSLQSKSAKLPKKAALVLKNSTLLAEDRVYHELMSRNPLGKLLDERIDDIFSYGFTEILNNAIEHSRSDRIKVEIYKDKSDIVFTVRDYGIGIFDNIKTYYKLNSDLEAIQDLLKGKTTTAKSYHSGEGIFFTSKLAEEFTIESHKTRLKINNKVNDFFIENISRSLKGTMVLFKLSLNSPSKLSEVFDKYNVNSESYAFDKTVITVRLYSIDTKYISRSHARRIMNALEKKFKVIILDFENVSIVGQGFADEIFRVFAGKYPEIEIRPINMNKNVTFMVKRAQSAA